MTDVLTLLAQADPATEPKPTFFQSLLGSPLFPILLIILVFWFFIIRGQRGDRKKRQAMLDNVKKNDQIVTVGGLVGTVVSVRDKELTVKIDESNNTKINIARWAVKQVFTEDNPPA